jgi:Skp family chaperone for outer membrane proteins
MKRNKRHALLALAAMCATTWMGAAPPRVMAQSAAVTIGVVDDEMVSEKYVKYNSAFDALKARGETIEEYANTRALLKNDEATNFEPLVLKSTLTNEDTDKIKTFTKTANDRRAEYTTLNGKVEKTADDTKRIAELNELFKSNGTKSDALYQKLRVDLDKRVTDSRKLYSDNVKKAVGDVAKDKKLTLVVMASSVMWNAPSIEITQDVLKKLNG